MNARSSRRGRVATSDSTSDVRIRDIIFEVVVFMFLLLGGILIFGLDWKSDFCFGWVKFVGMNWWSELLNFIIRALILLVYGEKRKTLLGDYLHQAMRTFRLILAFYYLFLDLGGCCKIAKSFIKTFDESTCQDFLTRGIEDKVLLFPQHQSFSLKITWLNNRCALRDCLCGGSSMVFLGILRVLSILYIIIFCLTYFCGPKSNETTDLNQINNTRPSVVPWPFVQSNPNRAIPSNGRTNGTNRMLGNRDNEAFTNEESSHQSRLGTPIPPPLPLESISINQTVVWV